MQCLILSLMLYKIRLCENGFSLSCGIFGQTSSCSILFNYMCMSLQTLLNWSSLEVAKKPRMSPINFCEAQCETVNKKLRMNFIYLLNASLIIVTPYSVNLLFRSSYINLYMYIYIYIHIYYIYIYIWKTHSLCSRSF